jgi:predicted metal-dependent hydrolase
MATAASLRALKLQASHLLPQRLEVLAQRHGFTYTSVTIKNLKSRWGSCDQNRNITLNLFLMQLPWHLIDYVLLHELVHTRVMRHGPPFWSAMAAVEPRTQSLRREIKAYKTTLG